MNLEHESTKKFMTLGNRGENCMWLLFCLSVSYLCLSVVLYFWLSCCLFVRLSVSYTYCADLTVPCKSASTRYRTEHIVAVGQSSWLETGIIGEIPSSFGSVFPISASSRGGLIPSVSAFMTPFLLFSVKASGFYGFWLPWDLISNSIGGAERL